MSGSRMSGDSGIATRSRMTRRSIGWMVIERVAVAGRVGEIRSARQQRTRNGENYESFMPMPNTCHNYIPIAVCLFIYQFNHLKM